MRIKTGQRIVVTDELVSVLLAAQKCHDTLEAMNERFSQALELAVEMQYVIKLWCYNHCATENEHHTCCPAAVLRWPIQRVEPETVVEESKT